MKPSSTALLIKCKVWTITAKNQLNQDFRQWCLLDETPAISHDKSQPIGQTCAEFSVWCLKQHTQHQKCIKCVISGPCLTRTMLSNGFQQGKELPPQTPCLLTSTASNLTKGGIFKTLKSADKAKFIKRILHSDSGHHRVCKILEKFHCKQLKKQGRTIGLSLLSSQSLINVLRKNLFCVFIIEFVTACSKSKAMGGVYHAMEHLFFRSLTCLAENDLKKKSHILTPEKIWSSPTTRWIGV